MTHQTYTINEDLKSTWVIQRYERILYIACETPP